MANTELMRTVLAHIEAHPETWNQATWRCGTGMCFAGWAAELSGRQWMTPADHGYTNHLLTTPDGEGEHVMLAAQDLLQIQVEGTDGADRIYDCNAEGLKHRDGCNADNPESYDYGDDCECGDLFSGGNTIEHIVHLIELYEAGADRG